MPGKPKKNFNPPARAFFYTMKVSGGGSGIACFDKNIKAAVGFPPGALADVKFWLSRVHPDDAAAAAKKLKQGSSRAKYRFKAESGGYVLFEDFWSVIKKTKDDFEVIGCLFVPGGDCRPAFAPPVGSGMYESLLSNIPGAAYRCFPDKDWTMVFISSNIERLSGYPASDFLNNSVRTYESIIHPQDSGYVESSIRKALRKNSPWELEYRIRHRGGVVRWAYEKGRGVKGPDGKASWLDGIILDITKLKLLEKQNKHTEERLRATLMSIGDGVISTDSDGLVTDMNAAAELITGYGAEEAAGKFSGDILKIFKTGTSLPAENPVSASLSEGKTVSLQDDTTLVDKNGAERQIADSCAPIRDAGGSVTGAVLVFRDVSREHRARIKEEFELRFQKTVADVSARFVNLQDESFDFAVESTLAYLGRMFEVDRSYLFRFSENLETMDNTHEWCADGVEAHKDRVQGYPVKKMAWLKNKLKSFQPLHVPDVDALGPEAGAEKKEFRAQGIRSLVCFPFRGRSGRLTGFLGFDTVREVRSWSENHILILQVVAEIIAAAISRIEAFKNLRESEERFENLAGQGGIIFWEADKEGLYTYVSGASTRITGYRPDELVGKKHFYDLCPAAGSASLKKVGLDLIKIGKPLYSMENRLKGKDKRVIRVLASGAAIADSEGKLQGFRGSYTCIGCREIKNSF